jgi:single-stranded-DNA-specific exonuclease
LRSLGWYESKPQPNIGELLDLVALGSGRRGAAGCQQPDSGAPGPRADSRRRARPGIKAILEVAKREPARITSTDLVSLSARA